ncbi:DUF397 domain-containing protein [Streptomyces sp. SCA3-4]|uniref:DUF397 domain-containing protein n=1 Tax=Streptomyces sichuanensis TaxID=2871810 RepID=UPI001CE25FFF|nr:DUF397 domain-containing protein [Streptomyces sichuanensis]MCA6092992.1 DUF397 domain-containing protein [Streptomyces sichuanensis]
MRADLSAAVWRKSTYSDGQEDCLEVADSWRKSTHSTANDDCLEVADNIPTALIPVRDSKNPTGPSLLIEAGAWSAFVDFLKAAAPRG